MKKKGDKKEREKEKKSESSEIFTTFFYQKKKLPEPYQKYIRFSLFYGLLLRIDELLKIKKERKAKMLNLIFAFSKFVQKLNLFFLKIGLIFNLRSCYFKFIFYQKLSFQKMFKKKKNKNK